MLRALGLFCVSLVCLRGADDPRFAVASIRPHAPEDSLFGVKMPNNGRFSSTGTVAKLIVMLAYDVQDSQISGGPGWFTTEKWDVEARSDNGAAHTAEETRRMLQTLLSDRFALSIHREMQQRPAYVLTVAKSGPKIQPKTEIGRTNIQVTSNSVHLESGELARLAQVLSTALGRPVLDRTGLTGLYDLLLQWDDAPVREGGVPGLDPSVAPGNSFGSIFSAIQEQLGLRLESRQAPVEVVVIDSIERPSPN